jgi:hypothetical protein
MSNVIEVGQHSERFLLDYMADGSTVAQLIFAIGIVKIVKKRCGYSHAAEAEMLQTAGEARERILRFAKRWEAQS